MDRLPAISFSQSQLKIFFATLAATFIMAALQMAGIKSPLRIVAPLPEKQDVFFDVITPKLEKVENSFSLQKEHAILPQVSAAGDYDEAAAYIVVDLDTGDVLAEKNPGEELPIASLTKVMTSVVALDLADPAEHFTVSPTAAAKIPTKIGAKSGEKLTLEELLHAALLTSANDAVEVIKEGVDAKYGEDIFIKAMNEKALLLGLEHSSFANAQGFDDKNNYSTVEDMAVLSHYALTHYPLMAEIAKKDYMLLEKDGYHKQFDLYNWNGLIGVYPEANGLKIGNTDAAGKTTIVTSSRGGKKLLTIVLGAPGIIERDMWAAQLLDVGYEKTLGLKPVEITEETLREKYKTWKFW